jgi:hypothetical protein
MDPIETRQDFFAAIDESLAKIGDLVEAHPDKRSVLEDFEMQLDIMRRRTAEGQVPTELERQRIKIQWQTKFHFPTDKVDDLPPMTTLMALKRLRDIAYCYRNWEEIR